MSTPSRDDWPDKCPNCGCDGGDKEDDPFWLDDGECCSCGQHPWKWELEQAKERIKLLEGVIQKGTEDIDKTATSLEYTAPEIHHELYARIHYRTEWMRGAKSSTQDNEVVDD